MVDGPSDSLLLCDFSWQYSIISYLASSNMGAMGAMGRSSAPMKSRGEANGVVVQMLRQPIDTAVIYMLQYAP